MQNSKFFCFSLLLFCIVQMTAGDKKVSSAKVDVGIILDLDTIVGKISKTCISMAIQDFYADRNYSTRIVPHFKNANSDVVAAASATIHLLKNIQVQAIFGPQRSTQADFVIDIGDRARVPIISTATSPALSPKESRYFIRSAQCSSFQVKAIASIVKAFGWREVVFVYEDSNYGSGLTPFLTESLLEINAFVSYQSTISPYASNDQILQELYKLKTMQTRVFVVHMLPSLALRFFQMVKEADMMDKGYAWIIADALTSLLDSVDSTTIDAMQGVLGVKAYVPRSSDLDNFTSRWRKKFHKENPDMDRTKLNVIGLWAYDSMTSLAIEIERVGVTVPQFETPINGENLTDLEAIGISKMGPSLIKSLRNTRFKGLSGDFHIVDGQLESFAFQIVNIVGAAGEKSLGFWTEKYGLSKKLKPDNPKAMYSTNKDNLGAITWPGDTSIVPKGWEMPVSEKKLRVGVPVKNGFSEFIKVERDVKTNEVIATGYSIDVFKEVMLLLPYAVPYDFIPFETPDGQSSGNYNDLVYQIFLEARTEYDAVVGDVTILANRSRYVDFSLPYTESGVTIIVPVKDDERKNAWIFMKPLTMGLWLTIGAFFVFTGFVVWVLEHRVNKEFRGPPFQQVGMIFWFSFSTLVFAHKEKVVSNLTRFVVIVWIFVVLVLTSSYTANLTSMLTVQQLQPTITDIYDLIKNREYVGYHDGSFINGFLRSMNFDSSKLINLSSFEEYNEALSKGSRNGGVAAIVEELPYIRLFLAKYCHKYTTVGQTYKTAGFGFAFTKNSPLVPDVSRALLKVAEGEEMVRISRKWLREEEDCLGSEARIILSGSLTADSFKGLFLIAGVSSSLALATFLFIFFYENRVILTSNASIRQKFSALVKVFDEENEISSTESRTPTGIATAQSPATSISYDDHQATEPGTPIHEGN